MAKPSATYVSMRAKRRDCMPKGPDEGGGAAAEGVVVGSSSSSERCGETVAWVFFTELTNESVARDRMIRKTTS